MRATARRWYGDPALVEAVFELRPEQANDAPTQQLSNDAMTAVASKLRGFSARVERLVVHSPTSRYGLSAGEHVATESVFRTCTWNEEGDRAVQFGGGVCAFNVLGPYGHYEDHLPSLRRVIETYLGAAKLQVGVRCVQRYLNVFTLQSDERPDELFCFYPPLPPALIKQHVAVSVRIEAVAFHNGVCNVRLWRHTVDEQEVVYRMEVSSRSTGLVRCNIDDILEWHQIAHAAVNKAFDMSITPACRKRLREL